MDREKLGLSGWILERIVVAGRGEGPVWWWSDEMNHSRRSHGKQQVEEGILGIH